MDEGSTGLLRGLLQEAQRRAAAPGSDDGAMPIWPRRLPWRRLIVLALLIWML